MSHAFSGIAIADRGLFHRRRLLRRLGLLAMTGKERSLRAQRSNLAERDAIGLAWQIDKVRVQRYSPPYAIREAQT